MTDLCKNCGACHLGVDPAPCTQPLQFCDKCKQMGHGSMFCPKGSFLPDGKPGPLYLMLCSNCDRWHLPEPCKIPLQQCRQCGYYGHTPQYCPVAPVPGRPLRVITQPQPPSRPPDDSRKRQRQEDEENGRLMVTLPLRVLEPKHIHPALMAKLMSRYQQFFQQNYTRLLIQHTREDMLAYLMRGVPLPPLGDSFRSEIRPAMANSGTGFAIASALQDASRDPATMKPPALFSSPAMEQPGGGPVTPLTTHKSKPAVQQDRRAGEANVRPGQHYENPQVGSFDERPSPLGFQTAPSATRHDYSAQNPPQTHSWLLSTAAGDLNALANAAEHVTARADPAPFDFGGRVQGFPSGGQPEEQSSASDFN